MGKDDSRPASRLGAIFDWDGVVIDSSRHHEESWNRLAREENRILPEGHFLKGFGMKNEAIIPAILHWTGEEREIRRLSLRKEVLYRDIIREWGIDPLPGVRVFLERLRTAGIPRAIGSSTHRLNISTSLEILGLAGFFSAIVSAEDVTAGKPDPQVFLLAAAELDRAPALSVVFEDAPMGIAAALAGGMKAVGVSGTHGSSVLAGAHKVVRRLDELAVADLEALFG
ncbi:MAG TPA: HAD family phosphatase [Fibrobacteria bacterium]|nr:HAD family phosphatase [Fibrobacteria bacterium]